MKLSQALKAMCAENLSPYRATCKHQASASESVITAHRESYRDFNRPFSHDPVRQSWRDIRLMRHEGNLEQLGRDPDGHTDKAALEEDHIGPVRVQHAQCVRHAA